MPRNAKCRRVCAEFENKVFTPKEYETTPIETNEHGIKLHANEIQQETTQYLTMNVEELEALRLCDLEGLEQSDAAARMQVSRGTLQRILYSARQKSAKALCEGMGVLIQGGNYEIASQPCECRNICKSCRRYEVEGQ